MPGGRQWLAIVAPVAGPPGGIGFANPPALLNGSPRLHGSATSVAAGATFLRHTMGDVRMFHTSLMQSLGYAPKREQIKRRGRRLSIDVLEDRRLLATLFVDDDLAQKHNADFTSIQAAVNAAQPGDTIRVLPGTYNESVTVDKKLTILGAQSDVNHSGDQDEHDNGDDNEDEEEHNNHKKAHDNQSAQPSIVEIPAGGTAGFNLTANDIVIRGFTIQDADANGNNAVGVNTSRQTSGDVIAKNIIQDTVFGIYLNTNCAHTTVVEKNLIRNNNNPGSASGNGIYSDQGASNVVIAHNFFTGNTNASIIFVGGDGSATSTSNQLDLTIKGNTMLNDAPMIFVNTADSHITNNTSTGSAGSGIFFGGGVTNTEVRHNTLTDGAFTGINLRTNAFGNAPAPNSNIQIVDNKISGFGDAGIRLSGGATGILVSHNDLKHNATDGITLDGAVSNQIEKNHVESNGHDGIHADATSTGNTFTKNEAKQNALFDYQDESVGTGTAGTANTWTKNKGKTASPPGLIG
jgi:parallel beta-helix repeat protein